MARATTPQDLTITPRDRRFGRGTNQARWWMGGDPVATAFYNALSATFPKGEAYFVESVRMFRDGTPPKLAAEIKALRHPGGDAQPRACPVQQARARGRLRHVRRSRRGSNGGSSITRARPPIVNLAATMCARAFHRDPRPPAARQSAPSRRRRSRRARPCGAGTRSRRSSIRASPTTPGCTPPGDWPRCKRWKIKAQGDAVRHPQLRRRPHARHARAARARTGSPARAPGRGCSGSPGCGPGMLRKILGAWLAFFLPGFHPWNQDDRALIAQSGARLQAQGECLRLIPVQARAASAHPECELEKAYQGRSPIAQPPIRR